MSGESPELGVCFSDLSMPCKGWGLAERKGPLLLKKNPTRSSCFYAKRGPQAETTRVAASLEVFNPLFENQVEAQ